MHLNLIFKKLSILVTLCFSINLIAQKAPGGVTHSHVWYIANEDNIVNSDFINNSEDDINIKDCGEITHQLFNFNPSAYSEDFCLNWTANLENKQSSTFFMVNEPNALETNYSHFSTLWHPSNAQTTSTDSIQRNFFDFNSLTSWNVVQKASHANDKNAFIQRYYNNEYDKDKVFKSYGKQGETQFFVGKQSSFDPNISISDNSFSGKIPEFIYYSKELTSNEQLRIESYLGVKYGLNLHSSKDYLSSSNREIWKKENNTKFPNRTFGLGRDDISTLNQLQSESTHLKNHLIAAVGEIKETNTEKQAEILILDQQFLLFGDNNGSLGLDDENDNGVRKLFKVWLAQRTGFSTPNYDIDFKFYLPPDIISVLENNPDFKVWMIHDELEDNAEVSDFQSGHVKYYSGTVDATMEHAYFSNVNFDTDDSVFDQFTFGVGPELIVQLSYQGCEPEVDVTIDITGGRREYTIAIEGDDGYYEEHTVNDDFIFTGADGVTYTVTVIDANGITQTQQITISMPNLPLDLGPDLVLNNSNTSFDLGASINITDPDATYKWYKDGILLTETSGILTVDEIGTYTVEVTDGENICTVFDTITVSKESVNATIIVQNVCEAFGRTIDITAAGGTAPYLIEVGYNGITTSYISNSTESILDPQNGTYTVTVTDQLGSNYVDTVEIYQALHLDVYPQLEAYALGSQGGYVNYQNTYNGQIVPLFGINIDDFQVEAQTGNLVPNTSYTWSYSTTIFSTNPIITIGFGLCDGIDIYDDNYVFTVTATDPVTGCTKEQSFVLENNDLCPDDSEPVYARSSINSVEDTSSLIADLDIKIYPNPAAANSNFSFEISNLTEVKGTVEVFSLSGQILSSRFIEGSSFYKLSYSLNVSGVYFVKLTTEEGVVKVGRVIIK
ncbi:T9SS type A sorting domain-containing protein [Nonlabens ulvanivorans]|uniref:T9SS type A sorting domain-containing protein n=1 Tax=Nonlabens ulvanivorans TaxID=906888 RepID=UPI002942C45F|nr:T9SS type A sorting domain-containing protein [Nonlabens ulvanivorans]WOI21622.1 T9SS type A sorting domain-containing protein [Nonlabens ulvanivorans]